MQENKIPKIIHYVWFGHNPKGELIEKCMASWKYHMQGYKIIEWNEDNFDISSHPYTKNAYANKKWAFVSDYVRLYALRKYGGVYLDTDMYIVKNFEEILTADCVFSKEDKNFVNAAFFASTSDAKYLNDLILRYDTLEKIETIPRIMTRVLSENKYNSNEVKVLEKVSFYPFDADNIKDFKINKNYTDNIITTNAPVKSYGVHMWNYSWGHPMVKFVKKLGLHKLIIKILDKLKIKNILKKILKSA